MVTIESEKEEVVVSWLRSHGYYRVVIDSNHTVIEADGKMRRMVVAVRTPENQELDLSTIEEMAVTMQREPWVAVVEPDDYIVWQPL